MAVKSIKFNVTKKDVNGEFSTETIKFPYKFSKSRKGQPISKKTAKVLVGEKLWKSKPNHFIASNVFDAAPILLLLSQEGCTGIRFYQAVTEDTLEDTLVLVGIDSNENDLGVPENPNHKLKKRSIISDNSSNENSIIIEVGGSDRKDDFPPFK